MKELFATLAGILLVISIGLYSLVQEQRETIISLTQALNDHRYDINPLCQSIVDQRAILNMMNKDKLNMQGFTWARDVGNICK